MNCLSLVAGSKVVNLAGDVIIITAILSVAATATWKLCREGVSQDVVAFAPPSRWDMVGHGVDFLRPEISLFFYMIL